MATSNRPQTLLVVIAIALGALGCASTQPIENATTAQPMLRVFGAGSGRIVDFDAGVAAYGRAWDTGVLPGAASHGAPLSDSGWIESREGGLHLAARTERFADGATLYRELTEDSGRLVRVRFFDTRSDGERQGFRIDGRLPQSIAFAPGGGTLAASR